MVAYKPTQEIFCIKPSRYIQALCTQNRSYPTLIVRYNANKVPMIKKNAIIDLLIVLVIMLLESMPFVN